MSNIVLFTTPRPFEGLYDIIQTNAFRSWSLLQIRTDHVLIFADREHEGNGAVACANSFDYMVKDGAERSPISGVPLVSSLFEQAQQSWGPDRIYCYVNADIILDEGLPTALHNLEGMFPTGRWENWLAVARRWNVQVLDYMDFGENWKEELKYKVELQGSLMVECAIDLFAWKGPVFPHVQPFAIGRYIWDNALLASALQRGSAVVDITPVVRITHQSHHIVPWEDPDKHRNAGLIAAYCGLHDSTHTLTPEGLKEGWHP